jgi:hypothetical protein
MDLNVLLAKISRVVEPEAWGVEQIAQGTMQGSGVSCQRS